MSIDRARELAEPNTILRGLVGSNIYGLQVAGTDDRDEMGVCVEPFEHFFGLRPRFEQWTFRTQPEGVRSGPGDLDLTVYSLAKFARLALGGNPSVLLLLFVPERHLSIQNFLGRKLRKLAPYFIGDNIFGPYLGYMRQQRHRLIENRKMPKRPELVEKYGFDTKYAGHLIRLGHQGIELATTGRLQLPMPEPARTRVVDIRTGKVPLADVLAEAEDLEAQIVKLQETAPFGPPGTEMVERFVIEAYMSRTNKSATLRGSGGE